MSSITFTYPGVLWVAPLIVVVLVVWHRFGPTRFMAFSAVAPLRRVRHRPSMIRRLPVVLVGLALGAILLALAEPVVPYVESDVESRGLDIVLVLDLSSSMEEQMGLAQMARARAARGVATHDVAVRSAPTRSRLDTTKDALRDLVKRRRDDRIGLVVFSDHAYLVSPLTFDYTSLIEYIDMVDEKILRGEGMTAIGDGIGLANALLARQSTSGYRNKVIVVFTDGEHNYGRDPMEVLAESAAAAIRVHVIGVDLEQEIEAKPPVRRFIQTVRRDGGRYFSAQTYQQLQAANAEIDRLEKGTLTSRRREHHAPVFDWLVVPALGLIAAGVSLRAITYFADVT